MKKLALFFLAFVAAIAAAQNNPPAYSSTVTYTEGDLARIGINYFRCLATNTNKNPTNNTGNWELYRLRANNTVNPAVYRIYVGVGHSFTNLYSAWNYVANAVIDKGAILQLYIDTTHGNLNETFDAPLNLDQGSGARIQIVGDNAGNVQLNFSQATSYDGIDIDTGHAFGLLQNVTLNAPTGNNLGYGILADTSSSLNLANVTINNFYTGVFANNGSKVHSNAPTTSVTVNGCTNGITASNSSYISCPYASVTGLSGSGAGNGIFANQHSEIDATNANVTQEMFGYFCDSAGTIIAPSSSCSVTQLDGYLSQRRGYIDASGSTGTNYSAQLGGFIEAQGSTASSGYSSDSVAGSYIEQ